MHVHSPVHHLSARRLAQLSFSPPSQTATLFAKGISRSGKVDLWMIGIRTLVLEDTRLALVLRVQVAPTSVYVAFLCTRVCLSVRVVGCGRLYACVRACVCMHVSGCGGVWMCACVCARALVFACVPRSSTCMRFTRYTATSTTARGSTRPKPSGRAAALQACLGSSPSRTGRGRGRRPCCPWPCTCMRDWRGQCGSRRRT